MAKYVNKTNKMRRVIGSDNVTHFLTRGQSVTLSKKPLKIDDGVVEKKDKKASSASPQIVEDDVTDKNNNKQENE